MACTNVIVLTGRLTRDPEKKGNDEVPVATFSLAQNQWAKSGEESHFFDCVVFRKLAGVLLTYGKKGTQVSITGTLKQERWEKDGQNRSKCVVYVNSLELLSKAREENDSPRAEPVPAGDFAESDVPF